MAMWKVTAGTQSTQVEGANALGALGEALPELGLGAGSLGRLVCSVGADGAMDAVDPVTGTRVRVEPASAESAPSVFGTPKSDDWIDAWLTQGGAWSAATGDASNESDARRMELVFARGSSIAGARDLKQAADIALQEARDLIPAEAGAVLVGSPGARGLRFVAATGPQSARVVGQELPADKGIAGFVFGFGMGVVVADVHHDARHYSAVDQKTGYRTSAILAVPVRSSAGAPLGVLEVLNPRRAFTPGDLQVAEGIASSLAAWMDHG